MSSRRKQVALLAAFLTFIVCLNFLPAAFCRLGSDRWFHGDFHTQRQLARTVVAQTSSGLGLEDFSTGSMLFDAEWLFGTYLMAGIGLCQIAAEHPETLSEWTPAIDHCIRELLSERVRRFDAASWRRDPLASLDADDGHAAYLGYVNFLLGLYRQIAPANDFVDLNDRITAALTRRLQKSPNGLVATYPREWYPVDNAPILASIRLHALATAQSTDWVDSFVRDTYRARYLDPKSLLLIQAVNESGRPVDHPRGSGSALAVFFLGRTFPELGRELFRGIQSELATSVFSFGAIREYPSGTSGSGDIDSGPVIFGLSFSATGFTIGGARAFGDQPLYSSLYSSAILAGAPTTSSSLISFLTAGPLGNAILLAMLTTPRQP